jgi:hypothetical protein
MNRMLFAIVSLLLLAAFPIDHADANEQQEEFRSALAGPDMCLDIVNDETKSQLAMTTCGGYSGQLWRVTPSANAGYFVLQTAFSGTDKCLALRNDGRAVKLGMAACDDSPGQSWSFDSAMTPDMARLRNMLTVQNQCLGVTQVEKSYQVAMGVCEESPPQLWIGSSATPMSDFADKNAPSSGSIETDVSVSKYGNSTSVFGTYDNGKGMTVSGGVTTQTFNNRH